MKEIRYKFKKKIFIFNSLKNQKELFVPINSNNVSMYICGPTLYKNIHLGNCRTFIFFDIVYRYFKHLKYNVKYIRNLTDINKKIKKNNNYFCYLTNIKNHYLKYKKILYLFNLLNPSFEPKPTNYIFDQINNIKKIVQSKYAYISQGNVYFDVEKYNNKYNNRFGNILNKKNLSNNINLQLRFFEKKKNFFDFAIWKKNNKNNLLKWKSKWGYGIPGWHIGCSTISNKFLGEFFDIHGGGIDLKFPHHESEIIQSNIINNNKNSLAKYWIHTNMLTIKNKKMSKSLNNFVIPYDIIKGIFKITNDVKINPLIIKLYLIKTNYKSPIDFSYKKLKDTIKPYFNLLNMLDDIKKINPKTYTSLNIKIYDLYINCYKSMSDDFNIPLLLFNLNIIRKIIKKCINNELQITKIDLLLLNKLIKYFLIDILGFKKNNIINDKNKNIIYDIIQIRNEMRKNKLYKYSDKIRDILKKYIVIKDR